MSSHVYHEIFLHLNWHTKSNYPALRGEVENQCHTAIRRKAQSIKGVFLQGIGGTDDHVHVAVAIEPFVTVSDMVQELKGFSSHEVNQQHGRKILEWQRGYGVVSFGKAHLPWVLDYIANQREHHRAGKIEQRLECCESPESRSPAKAGLR